MPSRIIHAFTAAVGFVLLYAAFFLTVDEEGNVQNRLDLMWKEVKRRQSAVLSRQAAFLQAVSNLFGAGLTSLFGVKLFSLEAFATSLWFSSAAIVFYLTLLSRARIWRENINPLAATAIVLGTIVLATLPVRIRYSAFVMVPLSAMWYAWWSTHGISTAITVVMVEEAAFLEVALLGAFASNMLFINVTRWYLRKASELNSIWMLSLIMTLNSCLSILLVSPAVFYLRPAGNEFVVGYAMVYPQLFDKLVFILFTVLFVTASNIFSGFICLFIVLLMGVALLHRILWPLFWRPIYAVHRFGLINQHKTLGGLGIFFLSLAWPNSPIIQFLEKILRIG